MNIHDWHSDSGTAKQNRSGRGRARARPAAEAAAARASIGRVSRSRPAGPENRLRLLLRPITTDLPVYRPGCGMCTDSALGPTSICDAII